MLLHLDPRNRLVWRSPTSLQLGVERPVVRIDNVTAVQERMLAALTVGVTRAGLEMLAESFGAGPSDVTAFVDIIRPGLSRNVPLPGTDVRVFISGRGRTADMFAALISSAGWTAIWHDNTEQPTPGDIAVLIGHFVIDPISRGYWLRRDIPHLPIVFGDSTVKIGPLIEPGNGPCLWCIDRQLTDRDAAWPAILSQLLGSTSSADGGIVAAETASIAARQIAQWQSRDTTATTREAMSITLEISSGATSLTGWVSHPACECATLPETLTADADPNAAQTFRPTREPKSVVRA